MAKQKHKNMMDEEDVKGMIREYWEMLETEIEKDFPGAKPHKEGAK